MDDKTLAGNRKLAVVLIAYAAVNVLLVINVWPPWQMLHFFTFTAPLGMSALMIAVQLARKPRPFLWRQIAAFIAGMVVAAWCNLCVYVDAAAAV